MRWRVFLCWCVKGEARHPCGFPFSFLQLQAKFSISRLVVNCAPVDVVKLSRSLCHVCLHPVCRFPVDRSAAWSAAANSIMWKPSTAGLIMAHWKPCENWWTLLFIQGSSMKLSTRSCTVWCSITSDWWPPETDSATLQAAAFGKKAEFYTFQKVSTT